MGDVGVVNASNFCANGLVAADRSLHPHIWEVKHVYQNIAFEAVPFMQNRIKVTNRFDYITLDNYQLAWAVEANGETLKSGKMDFPHLLPHTSGEVEIPMGALPASADKEYFLTLRAYSKKLSGAIPAGHEVAIEQMQLPVQLVKKAEVAAGQLKKTETADEISINGTGYSVTFSKKSGEMTSLKYDGKEMLIAGLQPNFWRGITDNDVANGTQERCATWQYAGSKMVLKSIKDEAASAENKAKIVASFDMPEQESQLRVTYEVLPNGNIGVNMHFIPGNKPLPEMPRLGMRMILKKDYDQMTWLGRGPQENYADRKSG